MLDTLAGDVSPMTPATKLKEHKDITVYLDTGSASLLDEQLLAKFSG
jgi:6-phosphogluconolactonase/glucosamine-6-phosphate isomerase/deaminase